MQVDYSRRALLVNGETWNGVGWYFYGSTKLEELATVIQYDLAPHGINVGMLYVSSKSSCVRFASTARSVVFCTRASIVCASVVFCLQGFPGHANLTQQLAFLDLCAKAGFKVIQTRPVPS